MRLLKIGIPLVALVSVSLCMRLTDKALARNRRPFNQGGAEGGGAPSEGAGGGTGDKPAAGGWSIHGVWQSLKVKKHMMEAKTRALRLLREVKENAHCTAHCKHVYPWLQTQKETMQQCHVGCKICYDLCARDREIFRCLRNCQGAPLTHRLRNPNKPIGGGK